MPRTRGGINPLRGNIFNNWRFAAAKGNCKFLRSKRSLFNKIKLVNPRSKRVHVKDKQGNVLREMTVKRRTIYPPKRRKKIYQLNVKNVINDFLIIN